MIALVSGFLVLGASFYGQDRYTADKIDQITKVPFEEGVLNDSGSSDSPGRPANFLIVGSDSRAFVEDATAENHFGDPKKETGQRSDTVMIAHLDPNAKAAFIVSFPRDTWVEIPGGCHEKINAPYNTDYRCGKEVGGPSLLVRTIKLNFNVDINHYVGVDFVGFRRIIDVMGSIKIYFPTRARDTKTGLLVEDGCQKLDGLQALAYARSRHYEYFDYDQNRYRTDPTSDFGRIRRQQYLIRTLLQSAVDQGASNLLTANALIDKLVQTIETDKRFDLGDAKRVVASLGITDPGSLPMETLPTVGARRRGADVLDPKQPEAETLLARLRTFAPPPPKSTTTVPPIKTSQVKIDVRNGSGVKDAGADAVDALHKLGFKTREATTATLRDVTEVRYTKASAGKALLALRYLGSVGKLVEDDTLAEADVIVVLGQDWRGVIDPRTTTTTQPRPTTSTTPTPTTVVLPNPGKPRPEAPANKVGKQWIGCR